MTKMGGKRRPGQWCSDQTVTADPAPAQVKALPALLHYRPIREELVHNGRADVPAGGGQRPSLSTKAKTAKGSKRGMQPARRGTQPIQEEFPEETFRELTSSSLAGIAPQVGDIHASGVPFSNAYTLWSKFKDGKLAQPYASNSECKEGRARLCQKVDAEGSLQMAMDASGCRDLQQVLELVDSETQEHYANQLRDHVTENLESPHGNHVLQRFIEVLRPSASKFVLDELQNSFTAPELARHRYGCRVLERLIEHFPMEWLQEYLDPLFLEAVALASHNYGNFVLQHVLEHGTPDQRMCIADKMKVHAAVLAVDQHACSVMDKALTYATPVDQLSVAKTLIYCGDHDLLSRMAFLRGGSAAVGRVFRVVHGPDLAEATRQMEAFTKGDHGAKSKPSQTLLVDIQKEILHKANLNIPLQAPDPALPQNGWSPSPESDAKPARKKNKNFGGKHGKVKHKTQTQFSF